LPKSRENLLYSDRIFDYGCVESIGVLYASTMQGPVAPIQEADHVHQSWLDGWML
jgi:hypothetical protein